LEMTPGCLPLLKPHTTSPLVNMPPCVQNSSRPYVHIRTALRWRKPPRRASRSRARWP
jgi:hypothetical protein